RTEIDLEGTMVYDTTTDTSTSTTTIYQVHGQLLNIKLGTISFDCSAGTWSATVLAIPGLKFQPGPATLVVDATTTDVNGPISTPVNFGANVNLHYNRSVLRAILHLSVRRLSLVIVSFILRFSRNRSTNRKQTICP